MMLGGYDYISESDFVDAWGARAKASGDLFSYGEIKATPTEHLWTVFEGEGPDEDGFSADNNWYASPGICAINALGYLIADRPWGNGTPDAIWFLDDDEQAREDRRRALSEH